MAFAGSAGATTTASANSTIIGSGSSTTYYMMQDMDLLFNDGQGCQIFAPNSVDQTLNFACESTTDGAPDNNSTSYPTAESLPASNGENPYNDIAVEEPYIGSSNGIAELDYQGTANPSNGFLPSAVNFARSSRALKNTDPDGLNFVAYAKDGVDWVDFSAVNNSSIGTIPSSCVTSSGNDIEQNFLTEIWNGTISDWAQLCADITEYPSTPTEDQYKSFSSYNAPICVYTAQDGSGTLSTWDGYLGITTENLIGNLTPNSTASSWATGEGMSGTFVNSGCTNGTNSSAYGATHQIFENETDQLVAQGKTQTATGQKEFSDTADAIFFYSFGRYTKQCKPGNAICEPSGVTVNLGEIGHQLPTEANIIASDAPGFAGTPWAVPRYLYNVYGNGDTTAHIVPATPATVNYVSEVGFICKPQTETVLKKVGKTDEPEQEDITDPTTGKTYLSEISKAVTENGFFRLPLQSAENQATINFPAEDLLPTWGESYDAYSVFDPYFNAEATETPQENSSYNTTYGTNPEGYCKVFTTSTES